MARVSKKAAIEAANVNVSTLSFEPTIVRVRVLFVENVLGTAPNAEVYEEFLAKNAPDAPTRKEEVEALGVDEMVEKGTTVFPRMKDGSPFIYDYQWKGFFKEKCSFLKKVTGSISGKITAHKKKIDGTIFVFPRKCKITYVGDIDLCQRPLRASTAQGDRVALSCSEEIARRSMCEFNVKCMVPGDDKAVREWLNYGEYHGTGQWRNSGKGKFLWQELDDAGNVIGGNYTEEHYQKLLAEAEA